MDYTNEYNEGWGSWASHFGFEINHHDTYNNYTLPPTWQNGWIVEVKPTKGLYVASAWFTSEEILDYTVHTGQPFLWIFCIDCGDITITQKGRPPRKLGTFTQLLVNSGAPFRITIPAHSHACFTSVMIFDSCIDNFLSANDISYPIRINDAKLWKSHHIDRTNVMMVLEQIRWGIRGDRLPAPAYLCKAMELLYIFANNMAKEKDLRARRQYVTWDNEMKLFRVRERIDLNPLQLPTTEELCQLAEMSESKLRISFKSLYKITLYSYMRESVMKRAMQMLANDNLSIKNIATLCGYENPAKFAAAFKEIHGITPSAFRKGFGL